MQTAGSGNSRRRAKGPLLLLTLLAVLIFGALNAHAAATYYVRAGATGGNNGSDWNNAYKALPSALVRGATYYIAGGQYSGYKFNTAASGSTLITIKKATASEHGTNTGWSDSYAARAVFKGLLDVATPYWIIDGVTGGGPGSWTSGYGFYIDRTGTADLNGIFVSSGSKNVTISHVEIKGHGDDGNAYSQDGINVGSGDGPLTFSHIYIHDVGRCPVFNRSHNTTWEYLYTGKFESVSAQHAEIASMWRNSTKGVEAVNNTTIRWSVFSWSEGTGGLIGEWDGADIYGNIFVKLSGSEFSSSGNGLIGGWSSRIWKNVKIYNNSFVNCGNWSIVVPGISVAGNGAGNIAKNNLFFNSQVSWGSPAVTTYDYNEYIATTPNKYGTNDSIESAQPYANYASLDFTPKRETSCGAYLSGNGGYAIDMYGNKRGADGIWDRGAVEYTGGLISYSPPAAPTGLRIVSP